MKQSDNEIEMLAAGFSIQHKNGLIRFAHALLEKYASARAIAFDDWLAKHCDSDDLTAYERELAWDAWNAALSAPQASEAVRIQFPAHLRKMWSGGEVQAWLDEHQGVTPPKVSAKGSLERYRKWQAEREEAFGAGVKAAADLVKKTVEDYDANHGSTDCETGTREYPGEGATWVCEMQELEESIRALSAQPAQKEQSDE